MIYVDIVSDTICPWCYIGKRRFERALDISGRNAVAISWRPFQLNPDMPPEGMTREDYVRARSGGGDRPRQIDRGTAGVGGAAGAEVTGWRCWGWGGTAWAGCWENNWLRLAASHCGACWASPACSATG